MSDSKVRKITTAALSASQVELSVDNFISLLSRTEKDLMISSLLGKQYEGSDWDKTFSQGPFVSSVLNFRYRFGRSGSTSKRLAANMPLPFNISPYLKTQSVTRMRTFYTPRNL
jgi:cytochrome b